MQTQTAHSLGFYKDKYNVSDGIICIHKADGRPDIQYIL